MYPVSPLPTLTTENDTVPDRMKDSVPWFTGFLASAGLPGFITPYHSIPGKQNYQDIPLTVRPTYFPQTFVPGIDL
jgi:hypothetical protein